jgi:hypothetical protein
VGAVAKDDSRDGVGRPHANIFRQSCIQGVRQFRCLSLAWLGYALPSFATRMPEVLTLE